MVETLLERMGSWVSGDGPEADVFLASSCRLARNLADFPFPQCCTEEESAAIEERVLSAIESLDLTGQYFPLHNLGDTEVRFLAERRMIGEDMVSRSGRRGLYVAEDMSLGIAVNDANHVTIRAFAAGLELQELWSRVSAIDDALAASLDYAFNDRLGFLASSLRDVGTGLQACTLLHLPSAIASGGLAKLAAQAEEKRHMLLPMFPGGKEALGDFFLLSNVSTLGRSEDEILFHLKHLSGELAQSERNERDARLRDARLQVEDRIGRALGLARNARLLAFDEGLRVLSSLRLGVANGLLDQYTYPNIADTFIASQDAHLALKSGHAHDELTLSACRADLFRARFA